MLYNHTIISLVRHYVNITTQHHHHFVGRQQQYYIGYTSDTLKNNTATISNTFYCRTFYQRPQLKPHAMVYRNKDVHTPHDKMLLVVKAVCNNYSLLISCFNLISFTLNTLSCNTTTISLADNNIENNI